MESPNTYDISINSLRLSERFPKVFDRSINEDKAEKSTLKINLNSREPESRLSRFSVATSPFNKKKLKAILELRNKKEKQKGDASEPNKNLKNDKRGFIPVQKLFYKLRMKKYFKSFEKLSNNHYIMIGDLATSSIYNCSPLLKKNRSLLSENTGNTGLVSSKHKNIKLKATAVISFFTSLVKFADKKIPLFDSSTFTRILWDLFILVLCIAQIFIYSIEKCFGTDLENTFLCSTVTLFLWVDILVKLNTLLYIEGLQIRDRKKIFPQFLKNNIITDVIPCLCMNVLVFSSSSEGILDLNLLMLLKIQNVFELGEKISELLIKGDMSQSIYDLFILILTILIWAHMIACLWHYIGYNSQLKNPTGNNWLKIKGIFDEEWPIRYLFSIYWGVTTMLTVGYGDIAPSNHTEMFFNIWAMVLGCGMFGYSMSRVGEILRFAGKKRKHQREKMKKIVKMMRRKELPKETEIKVKKYLEFVWKQEKRENPEQEKEVFQKLSSKLRDEIFFSTNVKFLKKVDSLKFLSDKSLLSLAYCMKKMHFSPEEIVYKEKELDDLSIYFVIDGTLESIVGSEKISLHKNTFKKKFKKNDYFGVHETFSGQPRSSGIMSLDFSTVFKLGRDDLIHVLKKNPDEYEKFCKFRDMDLLYDNQSFYNIKCESCGFEDHRIEECRFLRFIPNKLQLICRYTNRKRKFSRIFKRKKKTKQNCLLNKADFSEYLDEFYQHYKDDEDFIEMTKFYENDDSKYLREEGPDLTREITTEKICEKNNDQNPEENSEPSLEGGPLSNSFISLRSKFFSRGTSRTKTIKSVSSNGPQKEKSLNFTKLLTVNKETKKAITKKAILKHPDFDRVKAFKYYFPWNNVDYVAKRFNTSYM